MLGRAGLRRWIGSCAALAALALPGPLQAAGETPRRPPPTGEAAAPALSREDAALVRELALLERMEMLRDLDLFEGPPDAAAVRDGGAPARER